MWYVLVVELVTDGSDTTHIHRVHGLLTTVVSPQRLL